MFFPGDVVHFTARPGTENPADRLRPPWTSRPDCPLYRNIAPGSYVYFVHSFYPQPVDESIVATRTEYGDNFASSVWRDNVYATQFHPEKSQKVGLQLLKNFVDLT